MDSKSVFPKLLQARLAACFVVAVSAVSVPVSADTAADSLLFSDAWVRAMPPGVTSSAAYLMVKNSSDQPVVIVEVASDAAHMVQMHEHTMVDGMMSMGQVFEVSVPANGQFEFAPGGHHIMLMGLTAPLQEGDSVTLTLETKDGKSYATQAEVMKAPPKGASTGHVH